MILLNKMGVDTFSQYTETDEMWVQIVTYIERDTVYIGRVTKSEPDFLVLRPYYRCPRDQPTSEVSARITRSPVVSQLLSQLQGLEDGQTNNIVIRKKDIYLFEIISPE